MEQAILRVRQFGVCIMGLAQTHHLGRIGAWAEQAAAEGLVSLHFANVGARSVVLPFNGQRPRFGTNPFCVGIPVAGKPPVVLDFATSTIAGNKARIAGMRAGSYRSAAPWITWATRPAIRAG